MALVGDVGDWTTVVSVAVANDALLECDAEWEPLLFLLSHLLRLNIFGILVLVVVPMMVVVEGLDARMRWKKGIENVVLDFGASRFYIKHL
jgi:hypothetical protein